MSQRKLTERQAAFCRHLITGMSATEAARKAGYSDSYANREAAKLVDKPQVAAYLAELREEVQADSIMDAQEAMSILASIARGDVRTEKATRQGVVELPPDFGERTRALELYGKFQNWFTEKQEHTGGVTIRVVRE